MLSLGTVDEIEDKHIISQASKRKNILSKEEAHFWFKYDWTQGCLMHRWAHYLRRDKAGWFYKDSARLTIFNKNYSVAATIWTLFFGEIPEDFIIAYKDGDSYNTKIENLFIRHYSFINRKRSKQGNYNFERHLTGVSFIDDSDRRGWQAKFKGHSSFGGVTKTGILRNTVEEARLDYVKLKTEYMRGLFIYPLWDENELIFLEHKEFLEPDMVDYFNSLPVHSYQLKYCYKDPYLARKILPDYYTIGDGLNTNHPVIQKYFNKYNTLLKPRASYLKIAEKKRIRKLLIESNPLKRTKYSRRVSTDKLISLLPYHKAEGKLKGLNEEDKQLLDKALKAQLLSTKEGM